MSDQPTATASRPAAGRKYLGLTRNQAIGVGVVFVGALAYILWKRRHAAGGAGGGSAAASTAASTATSDELAALQQELDQLLAQQGSGAGGGGLGGGGLGGSGTTVASTGTGGTGSGGGGTGTTTTTATVTGTGSGSGGGTKSAGAISNLAASAVTKSSFRASWNAAANATGYAYIVRDLASHTQIKQGTVKATSVTVSGLKSGTDYNFGVQGLPGGPGDNIHVRTL